MKIDGFALDEDMEAYCLGSIDLISDKDLCSAARPSSELFRGLNQSRPTVRVIRERVRAKVLSTNLSPLMLDILRIGTMSNSLVSVLSEAALERGVLALCDEFGRAQILVSMLLDQREFVRDLAKAQLETPRSTESGEKLALEKTFSHMFNPLLMALSSVTSSDGDGLPVRPSSAPTTKLPRQESKTPTEQDISKSTAYRRLQRTNNELASEVTSLKKNLNRVSEGFSQKSILADSLQDQLDDALRSHDSKVALSVSDILAKRMLPWLSPSECLSNWHVAQAGPDLLQSTQALLARQAEKDKRYGTRKQVGQNIDKAQALLNELQNAQQEALSPLPELAYQKIALTNYIEEARAQLQATAMSLEDKDLRGLQQRLDAIAEIDGLRELKFELEHKMRSEVWGNVKRAHAYGLCEKKAWYLYQKHLPSGSSGDSNDFWKVQHPIKQCLIQGLACRIWIDGHNVLPKIKPFIGSEHFSDEQGPTASARALLIKQVRVFVNTHPLLQADIWFDGPDDQHWSESDNLRVWFSGGQGTDRADNEILKALSAVTYTNTNTRRVIVSEDADLLVQAAEQGAEGVTPLEFFGVLTQV